MAGFWPPPHGTGEKGKAGKNPPAGDGGWRSGKKKEGREEIFANPKCSAGDRGKKKRTKERYLGKEGRRKWRK